MKNPKVDEYIENSAAFAQPILNHLRSLVHEVVPEVKEVIKWGFPFFEYLGPMASMAAFKQHAVFGFWKDAQMKDLSNVLKPRSNKGGEAMGNLGRIKSLNDLPSDEELKSLILEAARLNQEGIKKPAPPKKVKSVLEMPKNMIDALKNHPQASKRYAELAPSHQREYLQWIIEAKTETTQLKRIATMVEWVTDGKHRHWKYERIS